MFPNGVVYEGVSEEPTFYRGESGANDSIVPSADNFLQLTGTMPSNPLTEILRDFRTYRPSHHNEWLTWLENEANTLKVRDYCFRDNSSLVLYLGLLDQVREFRNRHWSFTKEYIIKYTQHPVATGGSPIITWLPNQLGAVLSAMTGVGSMLKLSQLSQQDRIYAQELLKKADVQNRVLKREVIELSKRFKGQDA